MTRRKSLVIGALLGVAAAAAATLVWVVARDAGDVVQALIAVAAGAAIGLAITVRSVGIAAGIIGVALVFVASAAGNNFAQRAELQEGIKLLQKDWKAFRVDPNQATTKRATGGAPLAYTKRCEDRPPGVLPPPAILEVLPTGGLLCMSARELATIWNDVPEKKKAALPADAVRKVEAAIAKASATSLASARSRYKATSYDVPEAVVNCAPQPDFTQPDAASGLGFSGGVPLFLPAADLFASDRKRGDGVKTDPPTPICFVRENAKAHPLEPVSWLAAAGLAFVIPFRRNRPRREAS